MFLDSKITKFKVEILVFFQRGWGWAIGQNFELFSMFSYFWENQPAKCV